jgi:AcrR family transcriptional regulator
MANETQTVTAKREKTMRKGEMTRATILDAALELASRNGLEGLTIGVLAEKMQMSKSGVFAHFGSREDLQIEIVKLYHHRFEQDVFYPSLKEARGLPRLQTMFTLWVNTVALEIAHGCIYISGAVEYDDRPGAIREQLMAMILAWRAALHRCIVQAMEMQHLRNDIDVAQMVYEIYGLILALHHDARFLRLPDSTVRAKNSFDRLINSYRPPLKIDRKRGGTQKLEPVTSSKRAA